VATADSALTEAFSTPGTDSSAFWTVLAHPAHVMPPICKVTCFISSVTVNLILVSSKVERPAFCLVGFGKFDRVSAYFPNKPK
jgi:hypothetical protein